MTPERYQQIDQIFQAALGLEPDQRAAYLDEACSGDKTLRREVESLITSDCGGLSFIDEPAFEMAARILASDEPGVATGDRIDRYEVVSLLGSGGMGEVYLAHDEKLDRRIALKLLPAQFTTNGSRLRRFHQEARAVSALNHPNILTIHELGEVGGKQFIATEFVDGETLRERLRRGPLNLPETLDIAIQIAGALAAAHQAGIVHRDIKPDNIMLRRDGYVKVLDFGLAKLAAQPEPAIQMRDADEVDISSGLVMGTLKYMSPEQARGRSVDARTDIFSLGVVLYEMLTGHAPFKGESAGELIKSIRKDQPRRLAEYLPNAPEDLQRIVSSALARDKSERYQAAEDLLVDLKMLRQQVEVVAGPKTTFQRADRREISTGILGRRTTSSGQRSVSGIKQYKIIGAIMVIALVTCAVVLRAYLRARNTEAAIESIAVLPFENQSHDPDRDYLSDGVTESIINSLSQLPKLKVMPGSSVFHYKGKEADPVAAGKELGVRAVLTGRIVQHGDDLTVSTELIDVRDNKQLWGQQYDEKVSDLLSLQRDIATKITTNLRLKLSSVEQDRVTKPYTDSPEAYRLYLKGRYFWNKRTETDLRRAINFFDEAIGIDPQYSLAYAGLADCYQLLSFYGGLPPAECSPRARAAAERAIAIDDSLAEAHSTLAHVRFYYDWDWTGAESEFKRAIELNPNYPTAHQWYGEFLGKMGRQDESLAERKKALALDPLSPIITSELGLFHLEARQYDRAVAELHKTTEIFPDFSRAHRFLAMAYEWSGRYDEGIAECRKAMALANDSRLLIQLAGVYAMSGRRVEAQQLLAKMRKESKHRYFSPSEIARVYLALNDRAQAFVWLETAYRERDWELVTLKVYPTFDSLRSDPRFADLMKRMNLAE